MNAIIRDGRTVSDGGGGEDMRSPRPPITVQKLPARATGRAKVRKGTQTRKEERKVPVFAEDAMI